MVLTDAEDGDVEDGGERGQFVARRRFGAKVIAGQQSEETDAPVERIDDQDDPRGPAIATQQRERG